MADSNPTPKVSYPRLPLSNWWAIRRRFAQSMPKKVDQDWLISVLNLTNPQSAANLIGPLRSLGLIDNEGSTTPLAAEWRDDTDYASACEKIRQMAYPEQLVDLYPPPSPDLADVRRWFMRNAGVGETAAQGMAALYGVICEADISKQPEPSAKRDAASLKAPNAAKAAPAKKTSKPAEDQGTRERQDNQDPPPPALGPNLHIDVQIHIPSDASLEQIDQIFASMGRHLYNTAPIER